MFKEVRNDFYDEDKKCYVIDAWRTNNDNEEGVVVAEVYKDKVIYMKENYKDLPEVIDAVNEASKLHENNKKLKKYIVPIECFTSVTVHAENLEEAISKLNADSVDNYKETFSNWQVDHGGIVEIHSDESEFYLGLDEISKAKYKEY